VLLYDCLVRLIRFAVALLVAGCGVDEGVPEGKLAVVGDVVIGTEDLAELRTQLGSYARRRFRGPEGMRGLLASVVDAELLAQEAVAAGLGDDPRVRWALLEEVALLYINAELERRVPYAQVAADTGALRAYYDGHTVDFTRPERRAIRGAVFHKFVEAEQAQRDLLSGTPLAELGALSTTPLVERDDEQFPGMHAVLFTAGPAGSLLPRVVLNGDVLMVGKVEEVTLATQEEFEDAEVQERLVKAVRAPLLAAARAELLEELAGQYPGGDPAP
jgi:hypothetical protein